VGTSNGLAYARPERWGVMPGTDGLTVRTLAEAADGTLWLGCAPTLLVHLDPATGAVRRFGAAEGVTGGKILDLLVAGNGDVWVATRGSGLLRKPRGEDAFRPVPSPRDTMFVSEDRSGRIWFGGRGPGARLSVGRPSQWRHFTTADGLLGNDLMLIQETPDGGMWVAYADSPGLSRVRLQGDGLVVLEHRTQSSGLTGITYFLGFDRRGRLWRGTGGGIDVLGDEGVLHFDTSDGLVGDDCAFQAFWADAGGDVLVGTSRGLGRYRAGEEGTPPAPPTTLIVEARLGSRAMGQGDPELTVPRRLDTLWVRFSGLSFANERRVAHQVRLLGLETDWVDSGAREVRYPALPPGRYLFEARARIGEREWGPAARLRFRILPAWWETWPARGLQAVLALALVAGFFRLRLRRLQRQKERLARLVSERTADLRVANDELQRLSQSDALTGLANRRAFDGRLARALARARRDGTEMTLLLLDLDCFKQFNDRYGHPAGDECLRRVAGVLGSAGRRPDDLAARYGGEEFGLVLPGAGPRVARSIADRIRHEVVGLAIPHDASTVAPVATVSIGVASTTPGVEATAASLLAAADEALYRAKAKGRNRVELAELDPSARFRPGVVPLRPPATARPTTGGPGDPTAGGVGARPAAAGAGGARRFPRSVE
jgi:diguanylate cyclase (GGDEF)-like protein